MTNPIANEPPVPTQIQFPKRATIRTVVAVIISAVTVINVLVPAIIAAVGNSVPSSVLVWLNSVAAGIAVVSGIITRIMAIPIINTYLHKIGLSASK